MEKTIGCIVYFIYEDIEGELEIIDYNSDSTELFIKYENNTNSLNITVFKKGGLGNILKKITSKFKIELGVNLNDGKRDIVIIDREYKKIDVVDKLDRKSVTNQKWYKYHCNKCNAELWILEGNLLKGTGCACCCPNPQSIVEGINDIPTTAPWMVKYFQNGYEEAKLYTKCSNRKIYPICPDCHKIKNKTIKICDIFKNHSIGCSCGDGISYGEKLMFYMLNQLVKNNFIWQFTKTNNKWCDKYKYDFYFEYKNEKYIIETHGEQHYTKSFYTDKNDKSLEKTKKNDQVKKELALANKIKEENYIVVDCRKSDLKFIKNNIINTRLSEIFDLSIVNWNNIGEMSCKNLIKKVCDYWNNKQKNETTTDLNSIFNISRTTLIKYLKRGNELYWCSYNSRDEETKKYNKLALKCGKRVGVFKDNILLNIFDSCHDLDRKSKEEFGVKLGDSMISSVCNGIYKKYKGFTFRYIADLTEEEYIKYDIENKLKELNKVS